MVAKGVHHALFAEGDVLEKIATMIIIPNAQFRECDEVCAVVLLYFLFFLNKRHFRTSLKGHLKSTFIATLKDRTRTPDAEHALIFSRSVLKCAWWRSEVNLRF